LKRIDLEILLYVTITTIAVSFLAYLGERRIDAYLSISILIYFISTAISRDIRSRSKLIFLDIAWISIFIAIVTRRVLEILGYG